MNYEVVYENPFNRTSEDNPKAGTIFKEQDLDLRPTTTERYFSMFGMDNSIYQHVEINHTVSGFNGNYFCKAVYFDVDNPDLNQSLKDARELVKNLYNYLEINPEHLVIFFSGSKGFHIGLRHSMFGQMKPDKNLPAQVKVLAVLMLAECFQTSLAEIDKSLMGKKEKIYAGCDLSIYNANRIFRTVNSLNAKSNLYKIGLSYSELMSLSIEEIQALAKEPRTGYKPETSLGQLPAYGELTRLWQQAISFDEVEYAKNLNRAQRRSDETGIGFFAPPTEGSRDNTLFAQAAMLFDHSDFAVETVRQIISSINLAGEKPLPEKDIDRIVKSASKRTAKNEKFTAKSESRTEKGLDHFGDWLDEWAEYYTADRKKLTCLFKDFDDDQDGQYLSKVLCVIGSGGTRKSYYGQNLMIKNILEYGAKCLYSSMEMGKVEVVNRFLDMAFEPFPEFPKTPVSEVYRRNLKVAKKDILESIKENAKILSENLFLTDAGFQGCDDYDKVLRRAKELYGGVDMLVIDGLSMMKSKGSETEAMSKNTAEIKQLAKEHNIFIPVICHTTKESNEFVRDSRRLVRGSEKILDNADFFVMCSALIDQMSSTVDNIVACQTVGHIKYYNKRGSGNTFNKVYEFVGQTKTIIETGYLPDQYPTYEQFMKSALQAQSAANRLKDREEEYRFR